MKWLCYAILALSSAGCAGSLQLQAAAQKAADVEDQALVTATWTMCRAISVGAWLRAYSADPQKAAAWRTICSEPVTAMPAQ
ncbi:MAG TPA: hypothetical protein VF104_10395 [Burkholderiales bacterium]